MLRTGAFLSPHLWLVSSLMLDFVPGRVCVSCNVSPVLDFRTSEQCLVSTASVTVLMRWSFGKSAIRVACWCFSAGLLAESGPGQGYIQLLVVLDQGCVAIVEDQVSQWGVQVVGLGKAVPCGRPVDHAVLHIPIHTVMGKKSHVFLRRQQRWLKPANHVTHTTEQAKEPLWVWLSLIKKVPSLRPFSSSSASFRFIFPTYQLLSSWWVSSARVYGLEDFTKKKIPFIESLCLWGFTKFTLEMSARPLVVGCCYCSPLAR